jgi:ribosomal protein L10
MKTKAQKKESIDNLAGMLPGSTITIFTTFARAGEPGLTVAQLQQLKRALRQSEGEYVVAKKTLVEKALHHLKYDGVDVFGMDGSLEAEAHLEGAAQAGVGKYKSAAGGRAFVFTILN